MTWKSQRHLTGVPLQSHTTLVRSPLPKQLAAIAVRLAPGAALDLDPAGVLARSFALLRWQMPITHPDTHGECAQDAGVSFPQTRSIHDRGGDAFANGTVVIDEVRDGGV